MRWIGFLMIGLAIGQALYEHHDYLIVTALIGAIVCFFVEIEKGDRT